MTQAEAGYVGYYDRNACDLDEFRTLTSQSLAPEAVPHAVEVQKNIPLYDMTALRDRLETPAARKALMAEWAWVLGQSAGVLVLKSAYADKTVLDEATRIFDEIIAQEREASGGKGDHFAAAGANDRIWNSAQKLCERNPDVFVRYFGNTPIAAVCEAWLGPNYQMTAQVNQVRPGGTAQQAHRDYHLGFQTEDIAAEYPAHIHHLSAVLTLQGGIAHTNMPVESGPTKLLPFSQLFTSGYVAWRREDFREYFEGNYVQLPLQKGDAVFFNPALFHAAGANTSADILRMANLLQVSCAFGRAMESLDRAAMSALLYPALVRLKDQLSAGEIRAAIAAAAEGYSFPTNLDRDPPVGGLAPETQAALLTRALDVGWSADQVKAELDAQTTRRVA
ncbi:phytanoyl-CoA dioxygenase family protein [Ruegeria sp. HKCCD8929]|uniref:phytanoyl-CoA dioxygenase family protein n=1 Tax=Ruegeria sp. HKCCD8929 TaxID=2683006 RepID=UPI0014886E63|nr:phytanoyl-CoA dioxygenase family protein [Ruegeria sp. HKCCD8929]